ncbi:hypothetical protein PR048_006940 [Dryococelus australis]|uniref:Uncharacterized protein n=1 Tax=Dryococelus australis TaxID=614101 RepID=A0ABQ9ICD4_9NEOP|nr:hypothetical protein PR048_006940 [Dryococelus australis]
MPLVGGFFLGDLQFPLPFHFGATPFSPHFTLIGSQDLVKDNNTTAYSAFYRIAENELQRMSMKVANVPDVMSGISPKLGTHLASWETCFSRPRQRVDDDQTAQEVAVVGGGDGRRHKVRRECTSSPACPLAIVRVEAGPLRVSESLGFFSSCCRVRPPESLLGMCVCSLMSPLSPRIVYTVRSQRSASSSSERLSLTPERRSKFTSEAKTGSHPRHSLGVISKNPRRKEIRAVGLEIESESSRERAEWLTHRQSLNAKPSTHGHLSCARKYTRHSTPKLTATTPHPRPPPAPAQLPSLPLPESLVLSSMTRDRNISQVHFRTRALLHFRIDAGGLVLEKWFSVLADETTDARRTEQLSISLRYVHLESKSGREDFIRFEKFVDASPAGVRNTRTTRATHVTEETGEDVIGACVEALSTWRESSVRLRDMRPVVDAGFVDSDEADIVTAFRREVAHIAGSHAADGTATSLATNRGQLGRLL